MTGSRLGVTLYVLVMIAVIVGVDFLFLRGRFWERLTVNVAITGPCGIRNARVYRPSEKSSTPRAQ